MIDKDDLLTSTHSSNRCWTNAMNIVRPLVITYTYMSGLCFKLLTMHCTTPAESKEVLEERLTMKEKNGAVLYIPEHRCWEEKGKIRKRPHSTDSVPESKRKYAINGTDEIPPLPISQAMAVNVGYTKPPVKQHGGMTMVEPVVYPSFRDGQVKIAANHVNDAAGNTDAQMDSLKKHLEATHSQLKAEREAKKELSRTVAKLQSELGSVKAHLADYKQQLEALQAFPSMSTLFALNCCSVCLWGLYTAFQGTVEPMGSLVCVGLLMPPGYTAGSAVMSVRKLYRYLRYMHCEIGGSRETQILKCMLRCLMFPGSIVPTYIDRCSVGASCHYDS